MTPAPDLRETIIQAGLAVLSEKGLSYFSQPRVATRAEIRQSHLTYYYPTRLDLLTAVANAAMSEQLRRLDDAMKAATPRTAIKKIASAIVKPENVRVIIALAECADQEPGLRDLFRGFAAEVAARCSNLLSRSGAPTDPNNVLLLHAMSVGFAVLALATKPANAEALVADALDHALRMFTSKVE
jgi:AcrR family transcriptional regulator